MNSPKDKEIEMPVDVEQRADASHMKQTETVVAEIIRQKITEEAEKKQLLVQKSKLISKEPQEVPQAKKLKTAAMKRDHRPEKKEFKKINKPKQVLQPAKPAVHRTELQLIEPKHKKSEISVVELPTIPQPSKEIGTFVDETCEPETAVIKEEVQYGEIAAPDELLALASSEIGLEGEQLRPWFEEGVVGEVEELQEENFENAPEPSETPPENLHECIEQLEPEQAEIVEAIVESMFEIINIIQETDEIIGEAQEIELEKQCLELLEIFGIEHSEEIIKKLIYELKSAETNEEKQAVIWKMIEENIYGAKDNTDGIWKKIIQTTLHPHLVLGRYALRLSA